MHRFMISKRICLLGLMLAQPLTVSAQTLCSRPVQPLCTTDIQAVDSGPERLRCLDDIARYLAGLEEYRDCLGSAVEQSEAMLAAASRFRSCLREDGDSCVIEASD